MDGDTTVKVKELIAKLQTLDPEMLVVVDGYEGGVETLNEVRVTTVALNYNTESYYGPHEYYHESMVDVDPVVVAWLPRGGFLWLPR